MSEQPTTHVVVIGGGYAGVMAANRLTGRADVAVTLVNARPVFVPRLRLHQVAAGTHEGTVDMREVLADRVRLVVDEVTAIDTAGRSVLLGEGEPLAYDHLVYAVGSGSGSAPGSPAAGAAAVPGAVGHTYSVDTLESARELRAVLARTPADAPLTVVGGGPTGIETAAELAERGGRVTLLCGGVLGAYLHPRTRRAAARRLARLGVTVLDGPDSRVTAVTADSVRLADGRTLPSRVTVWAVGFTVPDLAARSGLRTDAAGRLLTDETLTSIDDERIVAAGDAAAPSGQPYRMSAFISYSLGAHAADTVLRRIARDRPEPADLAFLAMCVSIGRQAAVFQIGRKDDTATPFHVGGRAGARLKEIACEAGLKHLATEARKPGSHHWPKGGEQRRMRLAAARPEAAEAVPSARTS
ncbi:NAD(P)/FAD-dependent oxidoreductase [Streptomyces sp. NPDC090025]|uniref:NAD(P)/FAD-dependent oxidoreductase n=1 Tax=Streptomyces sp. NPDC090025 TaxID=3365922 RepID=UPI003838A806